MYFTVITAELLGQAHASRQWLGACIASALQNGYHHETTYQGADILELEMRRRTWWILYIADRSFLSIDPSLGSMIDEDDADKALPSEL